MATTTSRTARVAVERPLAAGWGESCKALVTRVIQHEVERLERDGTRRRWAASGPCYPPRRGAVPRGQARLETRYDLRKRPRAGCPSAGGDQAGAEHHAQLAVDVPQVATAKAAVVALAVGGGG
jgi:hypothetical protein